MIPLSEAGGGSRWTQYTRTAVASATGPQGVEWGAVRSAVVSR